MTSPAPLRCLVVGRGWRAEFYLRLAAAVPERFAVAGIATRSPGRAEALATEWGVPAFTDPVAALRETGAELAVVSVAKPAIPEVTLTLAEAGAKVLAETPPAPDLDALHRLWERLGSMAGSASDPTGRSGSVAIAEQHLDLPGITARLALVQAGRLGHVSGADLSWTHGYHAVAVLRALLHDSAVWPHAGSGHPPAATVTVRAQTSSAPLVRGPDRGGWPGDVDVEPATRTLATLDFGDGRVGLHDFTDGQWFHPLRARRLAIHGSHGQIVADTLIELADAATPVSMAIVRRETGLDGNLEGHELHSISCAGQPLWRNPYLGARLSDEELAIAALLDRATGWVRDAAPAPYPLAEACQDQALALGIDRAADSGSTVTVEPGPWLRGRAGGG